MKKARILPGTLPLFAPTSDWSAPSLSDLPDWSRCKLLGIDSEFRDKTIRQLGIGSRRGAQLAGYSFAFDQGPSHYIPLRHPEGNVDCDQGLRYLRDNLAKFEGTLVGANLNVDLDIFHYEDIKPNYEKVRCQDIQVRGPLINENFFKYSLEAEAARWGFEGKDENLLKEVARSFGYDIKSAGWKACIPELPAKYIGPYATHDAAILLPIYHAQQEAIDKQGLNEVVELEGRLLPLLLKMRQRGIRIDFDHLDRVERWALEQETRIVNEIHHRTGWDIGVGNCMAAARVAPALLAVGITPPVTDNEKKIQYSITTEYLESITPPRSKDDPPSLPELIRELRQMNKLRTTFVASVRRYQTNGRIHSTFRQIVGASEKNEKSGAAYGRLSSAHPNIQQQPSRGKYANFWRTIYLPEEGAEWLSCDYSAVEPRWTVHTSEILKLEGAKELGDMYRTNPRIDPHQAMADLTGLPRKDAKTVGLGLSYRMGGLKLAKQSLKLPTRWLVQVGRENHYFKTRKEALDFRMNCKEDRVRLAEVAGEEAQAILDKFHNGAPFIRLLAEKAEEKAKATGILKLLGGRHLHFPIGQNGQYDHTFKAVSKVIQGTAAYQMKLALLALDKECPEFVLGCQIHDEVCGSIWDRKTAKKVASLMTGIVRAKVPFRCDQEVGPNWGNLELLCMEHDCTNVVDPEDKFACKHHALVK
jgi:DNA polymerase I-like protein with 3'-5' exonuclease and polymerase domains